MIENNFTENDSILIRVKKLNQQTKLNFKLIKNLNGFGFYLEDLNTGHKTGSMSIDELFDWTAVFALGFRTGVSKHILDKHISDFKSRITINLPDNNLSVSPDFIKKIMKSLIKSDPQLVKNYETR